MRFIPFRASGHAEPLIQPVQPAPVAGDMAVIRTVIGYASAPPALLQGSDGLPESDPAAPIQLAPVHLPIEFFDADELLG